MSQDRLKQAFRDLQRLDPMLPYRRIYRAKVMAQSSDLAQVDVRPYDSSLPDMAGIELRHGVPGIKVQVQPGCSVQIGWDDGKPHQPFAALWSTDASAVRVVIPATSLELGAEDLTDFVILGTTHFENLATCMTTLGAALTKLGQVDAGSACATLVASLPTALSTRVRVG
jgi:hypothetical protein